MKSIILIHPYFGKLPNFFYFWLESCATNTTINFLIITDQDIKSDYPNIRIINSTLSEVKQKIEEYVEFTVNLNKPYKLCDFRPIYYKIFSEYLNGYDFWGYCDNDMILGDIRHFITDEILNSYDYILGMGHMHLQRLNDPKYEQVWKSSGCNKKGLTWKEVFTNEENCWFDELPHGVSAQYFRMHPEKFFSGFTSTGRYFEACDFKYKDSFIDTFNTYSVYSTSMYKIGAKEFPFWTRKQTDDLRNIVYIKQGNKLYKAGICNHGVKYEEILYAHFYKRKLHIHTTNTHNYIIRPNAFIKMKQITPKRLYWYKYHPELILDRYYTKIKNRLNKYFHFHLK